MTSAGLERFARVASTIALLAGLWLIVSPWVYGASTSPNALNSWFAGGLIAFIAIVRLMEPGSPGVSWLNVLLGIWMLASPWINGYQLEKDRVINSVCVGVIALITGMVSANVGPYAVHD